jgi:GTPase SAR1 family protein
MYFGGLILASEEAQAMMIEIVPAAPDPDPEQQQQERDVTAHQDFEKAVAVAAEIERVLSEVQPLHERISQLLGPAGPHRVGVATGDYKRRCLAFLEMEMSITVAFLTTTLSPQLYLEDDTKRWLQHYCSLAIGAVSDFLHEVDPSHHTLLRRASQCFHRRKSHPLPFNTARHYICIEHPSKYTHLLLTSSDLGIITPQLAEAGALPLVGIDRLAKKIFRWLAHQGKMDMNMRVMSIVGPVGIGKTTLAVELCNRLRHETRGLCYFQCNIMAQASRGTDRNIRLLQGILSQVSPSDPSPSHANTMKVLVRLVSECLRDKRYQ